MNSLLVIPNAGCDGCITYAEQFVLDNIDRYPGLKVIFTGTDSQKNLRIKLGDEIYNHPKIFIDKENLFYRVELIGIYPLIVYLKGGKVSSIVEQSPQKSHSLDSLKSFLESSSQ